MYTAGGQTTLKLCAMSSLQRMYVSVLFSLPYIFPQNPIHYFYHKPVHWDISLDRLGLAREYFFWGLEWVFVYLLKPGISLWLYLLIISL